jgi:RNA polymerase sigma-70 factor (ECF subfamily)
MMNTEFRHHMIAILPRLRAFAHALAKSGDVADDLVQATCEKALRACDSWTPGTRLDSWMFRIMQNQWIDMVRYRRPQVPVEGPGAPADLEGEDGERVIEARLTWRAVRRLIDELPEEQRAVLVLVCVEGMSYREAAEVFLQANRDFPDARKAPEMLLKLGVSLTALNQRDVACATYTEIGHRYPEISSALQERVKQEQALAGC